MYKNLLNLAKKRKPELMIGLGIAGFAWMGVSIAKATPKAVKLIEEEKKRKSEQNEDFTKMDAVKVAWKSYIPATTAFVFSTALILGANNIHNKRNIALASMYKLSETAYLEFKEKVKEKVSPETVKEIKKEIAQERVKDIPVAKTVTVVGGDNVWFYDPLSDRCFESNIRKIEDAANKLNHQMMTSMEMCTSLNDFYSAIGVRTTTTGDSLGWYVNNGLIEVDLGSTIVYDDKPCIILDFYTPPVYDFDKL